jgi:type VI protein secretion system component Hcp
MRKALVMAFALVALIAAGVAFGRSDTVAPGTGRQVVGNAKIEGVGATDVRGFTFGGTQSAVAAGGGASGKFKLEPLTIVKTVDAMSAKLMLKAVSGQHIPSVTLELPGAGGTKISYKLSDVLVTADRPQATGAVGDGVVEEVSFLAAKVEILVAAK